MKKLVVSKHRNCIICGSKTHSLQDKQIKALYSVCETCGFISKNKEFHLNFDDEFGEYKNHNNSFECIGYVNMFERFIEEYIKPLNISGKALEFGSGPGPVLKELLRREGFDVYDYDPFFNPNEDYLKHTYNLITSTEVVEHFVDPLKEFAHLNSLLNVGGYLIIMTSFNNLSDSEFLNWRYRREASHISFYTLKSLKYIADMFGLKIISHNNNNVMVFKKYN